MFEKSAENGFLPPKTAKMQKLRRKRRNFGRDVEKTIFFPMKIHSPKNGPKLVLKHSKLLFVNSLKIFRALFIP